ncbi:hypothetical protein [Paenibacillus oryzisoli]|uniref:hypothetical protein n=1 Tax=Paenibacillus oryzisoli TaxID=1850517 RepID=UPI001957532C|nr:hypothetical protein [Paenibacillus oryzisoli]
MKRIFTIFMVFCLVASFGLSASAAQVTTPQEDQQHFQVVSVDKQDLEKVAASITKMNSYVSFGQDGYMHINSQALSVIDQETYNLYANGVEKINAEILNGQAVIQDGKIIALNNIQGTTQFSKGTIDDEMHTNYTYGNSYWWGWAFTFDDADTKSFIYALQQTAALGAAAAGIAALIPGGQVTSVIALIESLGAMMIANSMSYHNEGNGVTLNLHWALYYTVNAN